MCDRVPAKVVLLECSLETRSMSFTLLVCSLFVLRRTILMTVVSRRS